MEEQKPWWNDGDRVGGLVATTVFILVLAVLIALVVKFIQWLLF